MTKSHIAKRSLFHLIQKRMGTSLENIQITRKDGQVFSSMKLNAKKAPVQHALKLFMTGENNARLPYEGQKKKG